MLDRSLALRFKSRCGLPWVRTARDSYRVRFHSERGQRGSRSAFSLSNAAAERCELLGILADRFKVRQDLSDLAVSQFSIRRLRMRFADREICAVRRLHDPNLNAVTRCPVDRVYDEAGNVIETHEQSGDFKEW